MVSPRALRLPQTIVLSETLLAAPNDGVTLGLVAAPNDRASPDDRVAKRKLTGVDGVAADLRVHRRREQVVALPPAAPRAARSGCPRPVRSTRSRRACSAVYCSANLTSPASARDSPGAAAPPRQRPPPSPCSTPTASDTSGRCCPSAPRRGSCSTGSCPRRRRRPARCPGATRSGLISHVDGSSGVAHRTARAVRRDAVVRPRTVPRVLSAPTVSAPACSPARRCRR